MLPVNSLISDEYVYVIFRMVYVVSYESGFDWIIRYVIGARFKQEQSKMRYLLKTSFQLDVFPLHR